MIKEILRTKYAKYIKVVVAFILALVLLKLFIETLPALSYIFKSILSLLLPFIVSFVVAYILHPVINMLVKKLSLKRGLAIFLMYLVVILSVVALIIFVIVPLVTQQGTQMIKYFTSEQDDFVNSIVDMFSFSEPIQKEVRNLLQTLIDDINLGVYNDMFVNSATKIGMWLLDSFLVIVIIPILAFYMMLDFDRMLKAIQMIFPTKIRSNVTTLAMRIDSKLGKYIRSQIMMMLIIGTVATISYFFIDLTIGGLPYFIVFGLIVGLTNIIPYIGVYIALAPPVIYCLLTGNYYGLGAVVVANVIMQFLEGNILQPFVVGKNLDYHPLLIILSILFAGAYIGPIGIVFAVPLLIVVFEFSKYIYEIKLMKFYLDIDNFNAGDGDVDNELRDSTMEPMLDVTLPTTTLSIRDTSKK